MNSRPLPYQGNAIPLSHGGRDIKENSHIPSIFITDFQVFNETVDIIPFDTTLSDKFSIKKNISYLDTLNLTYKENVFSLEFSGLDYQNPLKNKYAYIMEGFEDNWTYTDADRRRVTYTNLDPGEYVFQVKGSGVENAASGSR